MARLSQPDGKAKRKRWKSRGGRRLRRQRKLLQVRYIDTGSHPETKHSISRETIFAARPHRDDGLHAGPGCVPNCSLGCTSETLNARLERDSCTLTACKLGGDSHLVGAVEFWCWVAKQTFVGGPECEKHCVRALRTISLFNALDSATSTTRQMGDLETVQSERKILRQTTLKLRHSLPRTCQ